jgi:hypothetical protein
MLKMTLLVGSAAALFAAAAPLTPPAHAQDTEAASQRAGTLQQREDWPGDRIASSRDNGWTMPNSTASAMR